MITQRDFGQTLTEFIVEQVNQRLEPPLKQLADLIKQVQGMSAPRQAVVPPVGYGHPPMGSRFKPGESGNPEGRPKQETKKKRGRPPVKANGKKRGGWPPAAPLVSKGAGRPKGVPHKIPKAKWASLAKRLANGEGAPTLAKQYGVTPQTIYNTVNRLAS